MKNKWRKADGIFWWESFCGPGLENLESKVPWDVESRTFSPYLHRTQPVLAMCRQWLWDYQWAASLAWVVENLQRAGSTIAWVVLLQTMSNTVDNGQEQTETKRKNIVDPKWELVCEHPKGAGSMLHYCRDTIHILFSINLSCASGSDIYPGHNINHTPWNWAMWLPGPGKHSFWRLPEIITGFFTWAAEVQTANW